MSLIVGVDNFGKAFEQKLPFIDKTLWIKEVFDNEKIDVSVIVRPRRFAKTFNMSMLHHFLSSEVNGLKTKNMFDDLKIAQAGEDYMKHQGLYPVISMTFKSVKHSDYAATYDSIIKLMSQTYSNYLELLSSQKLSDYQKEIFLSIMEERATRASLHSSLFDLTHMLYLHYGIKPWILIDEYDTPIQAGYLNNYYQEIIEFMRGLLGNVLKGNPNIQRAVVTGILRVAKEDLFSGLNNVQIFSVLNDQYAEYFGFIETEVDAVLKKEGLEHLSSDIKTWYNGYRVGNRQIYNPWSIARCVNDKGSLQAYWVNTSDNALIKQTIARSDATIKMQFESMLQGQPLDVLVDENMTFMDLEKRGDSLWSLLLFAGYLTAIKNEWSGTKNKCLLVSPNQEVTSLYQDLIVDWFADSLTNAGYHSLLKNLVTGNLEDFLSMLQKFLLESMSYFDVKGNSPEKFYHGFVMGLVVSLSNTHDVQSNKESGFGRYDVLLIPKDTHQLGLILEFKVSKTAADLQASAENALEQINIRGYAAELQKKQIKKILKIGLGFYGKEVAMANEKN